MAETTKTLLQKYDSLKFWETLEIKRRSADSTYDAAWLDITSYLMDSSPTITRKLDFDGFGFGEFFSGSAQFMLDNASGAFNDEDTLYSLFYGYYARDFTQVRYKAGYYDTDGTTKIDETVFTGLLIVDEFVSNLTDGQISVTAIDMAGYLQYVQVPAAKFSAAQTYTQIVETLFGLGNIATFITHSGGNINPAFNLTFDAPAAFNGKTVFEILVDITRKANSVFYLDSSNNIIVEDRAVNAGTNFEFIGGYYGNKDTNIVEIVKAKDRYNMINSVGYVNTTLNELVSDAEASLTKWGLHKFEFSGDDITNSTTANSVCQIVKEAGKTPKARYMVTTVYQPNVINFLGPCTISYNNQVKPSSNPLIWNAATYFNNGYFWNTVPLNVQISNNINFKYFGFEHRVRDGLTVNFLVEV